MEYRAQDLMSLLPYVIRDRARDYLGYVHDRLIDLALEEDLHRDIKEVRDEVDLVFFLRLLYGYFVVGFQNYEQMLGFFEGRGVNGFQIGSTDYTRESRVSIQWEGIARELERLVTEAGVALYVKPTLSVDHVLRRIIDSLLDKTESTK